MKRQLDTLPQVASQYLHPTKIELAKAIAEDAQKKWDRRGRVHFNVGGSQSIEDSLKLVRNASEGKSLMFAFEGRLPRPHARRLGDHVELPLSASLRPLRRACPVRAVPVPLPGRQGHDQGRVRRGLRAPVRAPVRDRIQRRVGRQGRQVRVRGLLRRIGAGHGRLRDPAAEFLPGLEARARQARRAARRRRDPDGLLSHRQALGHRALRRHARHPRVRQGAHQRPQSARGPLGARGADLAQGVPARLDALDLRLEPGSAPRSASRR